MRSSTAAFSRTNRRTGYMSMLLLLLRRPLRRLIPVLVLILLFSVLLLHFAINDGCAGYEYTQALCGEYEQGVVEGRMCKSLCEEKSVHLYSCLQQHEQQQHTLHRVFIIGDIQVKVPFSRFSSTNHLTSLPGPASAQRSQGPASAQRSQELLSAERSQGSLSAQRSSSGVMISAPTNETTLSEFRTMLTKLLDARFGSAGNHDVMKRRILDVTDVNRNNKVSLVEARTMWSLLQRNEFLLLLLLPTSSLPRPSLPLASPHFPILHDFCGDSFSIELSSNITRLHRPPTDKLPTFFQPKDYNHTTPHPHSHPHTLSYLHPLLSHWWESILKTVERWSWPRWTDRAKIILGLLDLTEELYDHKHLGPLYLCDDDMTSVLAYSRDVHYDVRLTDLTMVRTRQDLRAACSHDEDCVIGSCASRCDVQAGRCHVDDVTPNLERVCAFIRYCLLWDAPRMLRAELGVLLDKCATLSTMSSEQQLLQHSLLLTDLRSIIWNRVAYSDS